TKLLDFLRKVGREHLPWRKKGITPYEVWISEVMLQQTQVNRVIEYYNRFLKRFPTVQKLTTASWEEFLPYYQGLGYYARGRNMIKTAQVVVLEHGGKFPKERILLEKLPGVGPYTASAILSFAYGEDHLAWDTNLKRVVGRFFFGDKKADIDTKFWEKRLVSRKKDLNAALMDFGSSLCVARPKCEACMLKTQCLYYKTKGKNEAVLKKEQSVFPTKEATVYLWLHQGHRKYYSSRKSVFAPFVLPVGYASRAGIQEYFRKQFQLELAVRPPHKKGYIEKKPVLFVNAQILLGNPVFSSFDKSQARDSIEKVESGNEKSL
ncbi:MAG: hypothetical protein AAB708_01590, partial [Patescibacteria group bacterium]